MIYEQYIHATKSSAKCETNQRHEAQHAGRADAPVLLFQELIVPARIHSCNPRLVKVIKVLTKNLHAKAIKFLNSIQ